MKNGIALKEMVEQEAQMQSESSLDKMTRTLNKIISDGMRHGFFDLSVACEIRKERRREVTIKAGKNYRFVIPESELNK